MYILQKFFCYFMCACSFHFLFLHSQLLFLVSCLHVTCFARHFERPCVCVCMHVCMQSLDICDLTLHSVCDSDGERLEYEVVSCGVSWGSVLNIHLPQAKVPDM